MPTRKTFKRSDGIHFAEVDGEYFLTIESRNLVVCLNRMAFTLLANLDGFTSTDTIVDQIAKRIKAKPDKIKSTAGAIIADLLKLGILTEVVQGGRGNAKPLRLGAIDASSDLFEIVHVWEGAELSGGLLIKSDDISVIVPNVTDGPIKTCPAHTCTIPAGLFTPETIIRTFDEQWQKNFESYRCSGLIK